MPTPQHFNDLSESEQDHAAMNGNFLGDRQADGNTIQLFSLSHYYVERYYDRMNDRVVKHEAFDNTERLVPYIAHIKFNSRNS